MCSPRCTESSSICHSYTLYISLINDIPLVLSTSYRGRGKEREREVRRNIGRTIQKDRMESEMKEKEQLEGERVKKRREGRGQKGTIRDLEPQGSTGIQNLHAVWRVVWFIPFFTRSVTKSPKNSWGSTWCLFTNMLLRGKKNIQQVYLSFHQVL